MPGFILLARTRDDGDPAIRLGLTVSKKVGGAVVRNRMKRRFRALARELLPDSGLSETDVVLIGRPSGIEREFGLLREELRKALGKVSPSRHPREGADPVRSPSGLQHRLESRLRGNDGEGGGTER
jgi:ribonuclease P protein component